MIRAFSCRQMTLAIIAFVQNRNRDENRRLIVVANAKNDEEKPEDFQYRVRGPPRNMRVVKVYPYAKNE